MKLKIKKNKFKSIYLEITNSCNLSCPFCPSSNGKKHDFMEFNKINEYLHKIKPYTDTLYLHVLGEPMLHPKFQEIIFLISQYNIKTRITTNGTFIDKYDFKNMTINKISFSLQSLISFDENYIKNYFNKINTFLKDVEILLLNNSLGIDFRIWNDKSNESISSFNEILEYYLFEVVKINNYKNVRISYDDEFTWPNEEDEVNCSKMQCMGGKTHLGILVNGDVVLCCLDYSGKTKIGNLNNQTLEEILAGELYQTAMMKMQAGIAYFKLCESCKYRNKFN